LEELADISLHGGPVVVASQGGKNFWVGKVLQVGVVLSNECLAERRGN
jgi:hypothetical protein